MDEKRELTERLHDAVIERICHEVWEPRVVFMLEGGQCLLCSGVVVFRSESYFNLPTLSSDKLYIAIASIHTDSWLLSDALSQCKPDGSKKWGDSDIANFGMLRTSPLTHVNLYCNDWEFDVVCQRVEMTEASP